MPNDGANVYSYANQAVGTTNQNFQNSNTFTTAQLGWFFGGKGTGVAANASAFGVNGADNGNNDGSGGAVSTTSGGGQAAFLQGGDGTITSTSATYVSQTLNLPAGAATVTYAEESRGNGMGPVVLDVFLDGTLVGNSTPSSGSAFDRPTVNLGNVTAGNHVLAFAGNQTVTGDKTSFLDSVSVTVTTPEPASLGLLGTGALGLLSRRRRGV